MANPLSPLTESALNTRLPSSREQSFADTPETSKGRHVYPTTTEYDDEINWDEDPSSPFVTEVASELEKRTASSEAFQAKLFASIVEADDSSPEKSHTPFRIAEDETSTRAPTVELTENLTTTTFTTAKGSPTKSSPSKPSYYNRDNEETTATLTRQQVQEQIVATEDSEVVDMNSMTFNEDAGIDDTCFSTFSEVPNTDMTAFARLGQRSPMKQMAFDQITPRPTSRHTPGTARTRQMRHSPRSASPTPKRTPGQMAQSDNDTTNLLIDFTQQFEAFAINTQAMTLQQQQRSPTRRSPSKGGQLLSAYLQSQRSPAKAAYNPSTPIGSKKTLLNLLDIELPPAPTPRSIPSITIRELESLKSDFASQISSLKATLSGREAEVEALKRAVGDAERRVGEAVESAREEKAKREWVEKEKEEWERRGREFEEILKKVREEVIVSEKERNEVEARLQDAEERVRDAETRAEEAEHRAVEASTKLVTAAAHKGDDSGAGAGASEEGPLFTAAQVQKQIDEKVHALSTELHAIYKKKHVTKVAGLKKGFEAKTKEKTSELHSKIAELERRNDELQARLDGTLSGVLELPCGRDTAQRDAELAQQEQQRALIERQKAALAGKESELDAARAEFAALMKALERERVEKGELVAAVDEMLALQADAGSRSPADASSAVEDLRKSIGIAAARPSGLARPGFGAGVGAPAASRIAPPGALVRGQGAAKSRMMSNIERMGGGRGLQ